MIDNGHPIHHVLEHFQQSLCFGLLTFPVFKPGADKEFLENYGVEITDELKVLMYRYSSQDPDVYKSRALSEIEKCINPNCELVLRSHFRTAFLKHIPMVDFASSNVDECDETLQELSKTFDQDFVLYESGRSFHAYGTKMLDNAEWHRYLSTLLLVNQVDAPPIVDARWVGHSLKKGFSALRMTRNNTEKYLKVPTRVV